MLKIRNTNYFFSTLYFLKKSTWLFDISRDQLILKICEKIFIQDFPAILETAEDVSLFLMVQSVKSLLTDSNFAFHRNDFLDFTGLFHSTNIVQSVMLAFGGNAALKIVIKPLLQVSKTVKAPLPAGSRQFGLDKRAIPESTAKKYC